jgi:histidine triad (HIT) family protein
MKKFPHHGSPGELGSCRFCEIAAGNVQAAIVFEDSISLAFLDEKPLFEGHCLLITRTHYQTFLDLPRDLLGPLFLNAQYLAEAVQSGMKAEGTFMAINNTVSQSVPHFHMHVVPRHKGDGLRGFFWPRRRYRTEEELLTVQKTLADRIDEVTLNKSAK